MQRAQFGPVMARGHWETPLTWSVTTSTSLTSRGPRAPRNGFGDPARFLRLK
jgi:hypothetical protein